MRSIRDLKFTILDLVAQRRRSVHRYDLLGGRTSARGRLELALDVDFSDDDRHAADRAFQELFDAEFLRPNYRELIDPASWVDLTDKGRQALERHALDELDVALQAISPTLVELRDGAWSALSSRGPDSARQAAHSARELIDQTLRTGAPDDLVKAAPWFTADKQSSSGVTRRHRFRYLMEIYRRDASETALDVAEKAADFAMAASSRLMSQAHSREIPARHEVDDAVRAAEIALRSLLISGD